MAKRYGVYYRYLTMRAVNIETALTFKTDSLISALRRFIESLGKPKVVRSDHGTNFKGGIRELMDAMKRWSHGKSNTFFLQEEIMWHFNPPPASHMSGAWERLIRLV